MTDLSVLVHLSTSVSKGSRGTVQCRGLNVGSRRKQTSLPTVLIGFRGPGEYPNVFCFFLLSSILPGPAHPVYCAYAIDHMTVGLTIAEQVDYRSTNTSTALIGHCPSRTGSAAVKMFPISGHYFVIVL